MPSILILEVLIGRSWPGLEVYVSNVHPLMYWPSPNTMSELVNRTHICRMGRVKYKVRPLYILKKLLYVVGYLE